MELIEKNEKKVLVLNYDERVPKTYLDDFKKSGGIGVVHSSTGHENLVRGYCKRLGLKEKWLGGYSTRSVIEFGLYLTFMATRTQKIFSETPLVHKFCFKRGTELSDKNALVIGALGRIGSGLVDILEALEMNVMVFDSKTGYSFSGADHLKQSLGRADFVYLCISGEGNKGFFTEELFKACKQKPVLINLVRRNLVHNSVLVSAINKGQIKSYYADDRLHNRFGDATNVFSTGHVASNTVEARERQAREVVLLVNEIFDSQSVLY